MDDTTKLAIVGGISGYTRVLCEAPTNADVGPEAFEIALASRGYVKERTCKLDSFADVRFNIEYEVKGYDPGSGADYATLATCSACGAFVLIPPEYHRVLTYDGDELYSPYSFCPCCGAKVIAQ